MSLLLCLASCADGPPNDQINEDATADMADMPRDLSSDLSPDQTHLPDARPQGAWGQPRFARLAPGSLSDALQVSLQKDTHTVAVRVEAPDEVCLRLEDVRWLPSNTTLVEGAMAQEAAMLSDLCAACVVPTLVSAGGVMGVFDGAPRGTEALSFRVVHRDCELYRRPNTPMIEQFTWRAAQYEVQPDHPAQLTIAYQSLVQGQDRAWRERFFAHLRAPFEGVLSLHIVEVSGGQPTQDAVVIGAGSFEALFAHVESRWPSIVVAPCLNTHHALFGTQAVLGKSTHAPGGGGDVMTRALGGAFVSDESCYGSRIDPRLAGRIAAHELGHLLGLFHSDVRAGALDVKDPAGNLMRSDISNAPLEQPLALSAEQKRKIRNHPDVWILPKGASL